MKNQENKKPLEFNGKNIYFKDVEGTYWIAIKPICEALNVNYHRQRENLLHHQFLNQHSADQRVVASDGKLRNMVCLPEFFIYGWIFRLQSDSPELEQFQWDCYGLLYNHFHGSLTGRPELLTKKAKAEQEARNLEQKLLTKLEYLRLQDLKAEISLATKALNSLDKDYIANQTDLWADQPAQP